MLEIVLYQPEIPPNTGNIGRLCASNDLKLHLVEPLGFSLDDKYLRRSGMDYWQYLKLEIHLGWESLRSSLGSDRQYYLFSTKGTKLYWDAKFKEGDILVFGPETSGLPGEMLENEAHQVLCIPMYGSRHRSLNLSTSAGIGIYEALRQIKMPLD